MSSAPPPPVPKRMSMSNILHTVKRQVFGSKERTVVETFDEAKKEFDNFFELLNSLNSNVQLVSERYSLMATSLHTTWSIISRQFEAVPDKTSKSHEVFMTDRVLVAKSSLTAASNTLGQALILARELIAEMKVREENLTEFDYYTKKLRELETDRDKVIASGKSIKPKDQERLDRNIMKTNESRMKYETHHETLMKRLYSFLDQRNMFIAPVLSGLVTSEQNFVQELSTALQGISSHAEDEPIRMSMDELEQDNNAHAAISGPEGDTSQQVVPSYEGNHTLGTNPFGSEAKSAYAEADPFASLGAPAPGSSPAYSTGSSLPTRSPPPKPLPVPPSGSLPPVPAHGPQY